MNRYKVCRTNIKKFYTLFFYLQEMKCMKENETRKIKNFSVTKWLSYVFYSIANHKIFQVRFLPAKPRVSGAFAHFPADFSAANN